ncbi:MAG: divergent polysaccharide deacetylase family protein [Spirochaetia bacterium]|nr:divergent polysaccharide deacetylase family protein [Spirochaetia bacterium]
MAPKKSPKKKYTPRFPNRNTSLFLAFLALLASIFVIVAVVRTGTGKEPESSTVTTLWPYGLPEYHVEVPQGYEALLPGMPESSTGGLEAATPTGAGTKTAAQGAGTAASPEIRRESLPPEYQGERALPFPVALRKDRASESSSPTLIIVVDDAGHNIEQLEPFLSLPFPITIAVLPGLGHSRESAGRIIEAGKELILHQPMQALGGADPGPNAITLAMSPEEATRVLSKNIDALPGALGLNNHMGSAATRDPYLMRAVLDIAKKRGIYYLDSLTSSGTATAVLSREMEIPYWERDVFLDNSGDKQSILHALEEGKKTARDQGAAVMIGHVWSAELAQTLMDIYPQLVEEGYSLSTISHYMIKSAMGEVDAGIGD